MNPNISVEVHPKYGAPLAAESDPHVAGKWVFAHSLGEPWSRFYAVNHESRIYSFKNRNFVTPNKAKGAISFGCSANRNIAKGPQRTALEVALRTFFPDHAPEQGTGRFRVGHIDGNPQNNSIFNLQWIGHRDAEKRVEIHWPAPTTLELFTAREATRPMHPKYIEMLASINDPALPVIVPAAAPSVQPAAVAAPQHREEMREIEPQVVEHFAEGYEPFIDRWIPINEEGIDPDLYRVNSKCEIFSVRIGRLLSPAPNSGQVTLTNSLDGFHKAVFARSVALRAFYPNKHAEFLEKYPGITVYDTTIDHVNGNHTDDRVENLQFMRRDHNLEKGGKTMYGPDTVANETNGYESLPGEVWFQSDLLRKKFGPDYAASNLGRIRLPSGYKTIGYINRNNPRFRVFHDATTKTILVHRFVFIACNEEMPPLGMIVAHDHDAPTRADGTYRNWPQDLSLKTMSETLTASHAARKRKREAAAAE